MGGRSGGGGGIPKSFQSLAEGATENGMSKKLKKALLRVEAQIKDNPSESLHTFDDNGKEVYVEYSKPGSPYEVYYETKKVKDKIVTHNHPRSLNEKGIKAIGNSLSMDDIVGMVGADMKEMRAVTPKYTFSMKRPKRFGWNAHPRVVRNYYRHTANVLTQNDQAFLSKYKGNYATAKARLDATFNHRVAKAVAKHFGWEYTWKKNK